MNENIGYVQGIDSRGTYYYAVVEGRIVYDVICRCPAEAILAGQEYIAEGREAQERADRTGRPAEWRRGGYWAHPKRPG